MAFAPGIFWDFFGFPDIRGYVEIKLAMGWQGRKSSPVLWTETDVRGLQAEYKKQDKKLDGHPGYGNVAGSYQYSETSSKIDFVLSYCYDHRPLTLYIQSADCFI